MSEVERITLACNSDDRFRGCFQYTIEFPPSLSGALPLWAYVHASCIYGTLLAEQRVLLHRVDILLSQGARCMGKSPWDAIAIVSNAARVLSSYCTFLLQMSHMSLSRSVFAAGAPSEYVIRIAS